MQVKATSSNRKTSVQDERGRLILKADNKDEQYLLSAIYSCMVHGGIVSAKQSKKKMVKLQWLYEKEK